MVLVGQDRCFLNTVASGSFMVDHPTGPCEVFERRFKKSRDPQQTQFQWLQMEVSFQGGYPKPHGFSTLKWSNVRKPCNGAQYPQGIRSIMCGACK